MRSGRLSCGLLLLALLAVTSTASAHPLKLSLCEIEHDAQEQLLRISLRLFLTDVREALLFDPDDASLAFAQPNEAPEAMSLLTAYLERFFGVRVNGESVRLAFRDGTLSGEGQNTALGLEIVQRQEAPLESLEVRNAVFTDLFFDQTNIVYVHVDGDSQSLMLNKKTPVHELTFPR